MPDLVGYLNSHTVPDKFQSSHYAAEEDVTHPIGSTKPPSRLRHRCRMKELAGVLLLGTLVMAEISLPLAKAG